MDHFFFLAAYSPYGGAFFFSLRNLMPVTSSLNSLNFSYSSI